MLVYVVLFNKLMILLMIEMKNKKDQGCKSQIMLMLVLMSMFVICFLYMSVIADEHGGVNACCCRTVTQLY